METIPEIFVRYAAGGCLSHARHLWHEELPEDLTYVGGCTPAQVWKDGEGNKHLSILQTIRRQHVIQFLGDQRPKTPSTEPPTLISTMPRPRKDIFGGNGKPEKRRWDRSLLGPRVRTRGPTLPIFKRS